jgi:hypothetical protein
MTASLLAIAFALILAALTWALRRISRLEAQDRALTALLEAGLAAAGIKLPAPARGDFPRPEPGVLLRFPGRSA